MKKIINDPSNVVEEMLYGVALANPAVEYIEGTGVVARREKSGRVGVISGGGSGHEPAHAGYVGEGMLDAAVSGNVFASPDPERILYAIKRADSGKGVLLIIKNYSGDYMNFTMAAELAEMEDINVEYVMVRDDVSVEDSTYSTGRRGIAGTVFVHKIAGAAAQNGLPLNEVKRCAQKAADNVRSMGMALAPCILPSVGNPGFSLSDDEAEIGTGIHGEPGVVRTKILSAKDTAKALLERIVTDVDDISGEVALMVNGLGATPLMELFILNGEAHKYLKQREISVRCSYVGNYMTALEMAGCSLTIMKLDDELKGLLGASCDTLAFKGGMI